MDRPACEEMVVALELRPPALRPVTVVELDHHIESGLLGGRSRRARRRRPAGSAGCRSLQTGARIPLQHRVRRRGCDLQNGVGAKRLKMLDLDALAAGIRDQEVVRCPSARQAQVARAKRHPPASAGAGWGRKHRLLGPAHAPAAAAIQAGERQHPARNVYLVTRLAQLRVAL